MTNNIIDVHTHILPKYIPNWEQQFGYPGFIGLEEIKDENTDDRQMMKGDIFFRRIQCNCFDPIRRIDDIAKSNVKIQVLSTVPVMFNYWAKPDDCLITSQYINDDIAKVCKENPARFIGLGTLPMQDVDLACKELKRCMQELNLKGVEIGTNINGKNIDDNIFHVFWKLVEELDAVVFVHPWDMLGKERLQNDWLEWLIGMPFETNIAICRMIFGGIYKKFPKIKVYYAHGSGSFIGTLARIQKGYVCRPDLFLQECNPEDYLKYIMVDSLTHDDDMLLKLLKHLGPNNIMIGSDYPFPLGELDPIGKSVNKMNFITNEIRDNIMFKNACRIFKLDVNILNEYDNNQDQDQHQHQDQDQDLIHRCITPIIIDVKQDIQKIISDPILYSHKISIGLLTLMLQQFCNAYYNNKSVVDNKIYDDMVNVLKKRDSKNVFLTHKIIY